MPESAWIKWKGALVGPGAEAPRKDQKNASHGSGLQEGAAISPGHDCSSGLVSVAAYRGGAHRQTAGYKKVISVYGPCWLSLSAAFRHTTVSP